MISTRHSTNAFSAIELLIVLSIIAVLAGMVAPRMVTMIRKNAVLSAAQTVKGMWERASVMAQQRGNIDGRHFGLWIKQGSGSSPIVSIIYASAERPSDGMILSAGGEPIREELNSNVVLMSAALEGESLSLCTELVWYAKFGSGMPVSSQYVSQGMAETAPPFEAGTGTGLAAGFNPVHIVRLQAVNFNEERPLAGMAYELQLHHSGHLAVKEVVK